MDSPETASQPDSVGSPEPQRDLNRRSQAPIGDSPEPLLQWFEYQHLPEPLQLASQPFCQLAQWIVASLPRNPERTVALRKLLEAKDCAVRAKLYKA